MDSSDTAEDQKNPYDRKTFLGRQIVDFCCEIDDLCCENDDF